MKNSATLFFLYLFLISCLGQISSDVYLPALPTIRNVFDTTEQWMQLSLAVFMLGFSISHLIYGPISDAIGRKKPLLCGLGVCIIGTSLCLFSTNISTLIIGRILQGVGAGAGAALFLSILRDVYQGNELAKMSSFLGISRVILLASAPLIGSYLLHFFDWRACFTFLLIYAIMCLLCTEFILGETNKYMHSHKMHIKHIVKNVWHLMTQGSFMSYAFCVTLAFGGILAWLTTLPFLLQDVVKLTPIQFGWVSAIAGLFFIVGGFINALIVERFGLEKMLVTGLLIMLIASIAMLFFGLAGKINALVIMIPVIIYIIGSSFIFSNAYAGAMHPFSEIAGTAGAVFGFLQILGGAVSSFIMSLIENYNQVPLAIILLLSASLALVAVFFTNRNCNHVVTGIPKK
ncbi:MAG: hypothetical protein A3C44_07780 [Gammaproteobacteria bacterium RIFCSPHIGHO2_02_FULL_39_13]|nr:MAG: hypothetical protein A3C44_07780 [Gammaproteobacteria bacterium RIFCSPHIGHO2_02_FULL_39_13]